jgi:two-component system CheB/CheR fusion protein
MPSLPDGGPFPFRYCMTDQSADSNLAHPRNESEPVDKPLVIVGVGASAGGLKAFRQLFAAAASDSGICFVVIQHLDPTHESALTELLALESSIPVTEVAGDTRPVANHVYVIPPNKYLVIEDGVLRLIVPPESRGSRKAIDYFFRSLANDQCENAVGIVLSGTGTDGTAGLRAIKQAGGLAIAQDPEEAEQAGMPRSAIDSGNVDLTLPLTEIPDRLQQYVRQVMVDGPLAAHAAQNREKDYFDPLIELLHSETQLDFRRYRRNTLTRRVKRRMGLRQITEISDYLMMLRDNLGELQALSRDLLIGVTCFFRDGEAWRVLEDKVIAPLVANGDPQQPIRVWVAGCASGEEVYSVAMLLHEHVARGGHRVKFQIFATDIATEALATARAGVYGSHIANDISTTRLQRYFIQEGENYRVRDELRNTVVFAEQNVLANPPFVKLDLIICRNLLIYFEPDAQERLLSVFRFALNDESYLFLGNSETIRPSNGRFEPLTKKWRIYRSRTSASDQTEEVSGGKSPYFSGKLPVGTTNRDDNQRMAEKVHRQLLEEAETAIVVINRDNRIVYLQGPVDLYFQMPTGTINPELPNMIHITREGLRAKLRNLITQTRQDLTVTRAHGQVKREGHYHTCTLVARPMAGASHDSGNLLLTITPDDDLTDPDRRSTSVDFSAEERNLHELELELATTREQLRTTVEELETANEELRAAHEEAMAMNEELQSNNEELETSREELQSLNEELTTLNRQLESKVFQLERTSSDLRNLISSSDVATVFLDTQFQVRLFTPSATELFHLIASDEGRPLSDITKRFADPALMADAKQVLETLEPRTAQVRSDNSRCYDRRIIPYRTEDNRIEGLVLLFTDVTMMQDLTERLQRRERQQASLAELGELALSGQTLQSLAERAVDMIQKSLGVHYAKLLEMLPEGDKLLLRAGVGWKSGIVGTAKVGIDADSQAGYTLRSDAPVIVDDLRTESRFSGPSLLVEHGVVSGISVIVQGEGKPYGVLGAHTRERMPFTAEDVNFLASIANILSQTIHRDAVARVLRESEERFRLLADNIPQLAWMADETGSIFWYNRRWFEYTGTSLEEMQGWGWTKVHDPDYLDSVVKKFRWHIEHGRPWEDTFPLRGKDAKYRWFLSRAIPIRDETGQVRRWFGTNTDVTDIRQVEEQLRHAQAAAENANRAKSEFLANMSHEIRSPMTAIIGYIDLLTAPSDEDRDRIETIRRNSQFLLSLLNDILDLSKIESGRLEVEHVDFSPRVMIDDVVRLMQVRAKENNLEFEREFATATPRLVRGDAVRVRQILINLVGNAIKFTKQGSVTIVIRFDKSNSELAFEVHDTGIGIDAGKIEQMFQPFEQADASIVRQYGGSGLGLAISRRLAGLLGGRITVTSELGAGSQFTLHLPVPDHDELELEPPPTKTLRPRTAIDTSAGEQLDMRVLIVDDRRDIRLLVQQMIEKSGGETVVCENGQQAIERLNIGNPIEQKFDVVVMDMQMPVLDGINAVRKLRASGYDRPIIALTANAMSTDRQACLDAGYTDYLDKPIEKARLLKMLRKYNRS